MAGLDDKEVGRRVRAARAYKGISSVPQLARAINQRGLSNTTLYEVERAERKALPRELAAIAEACDLPAAFFKMDFWEAAAALGERSDVRRLRADVEELREQVRRLESQQALGVAEEHPQTGGTAPPRTDRPRQAPQP